MKEKTPLSHQVVCFHYDFETSKSRFIGLFGRLLSSEKNCHAFWAEGVENWLGLLLQLIASLLTALPRSQFLNWSRNVSTNLLQSSSEDCSNCHDQGLETRPRQHGAITRISGYFCPQKKKLLGFILGQIDLLKIQLKKSLLSIIRSMVRVTNCTCDHDVTCNFGW